MSYATISNSLSLGHLRLLKKRWRHGRAVEHTLIAVIIALTAFQVVFVVTNSPSPAASAPGALSPLSAPVQRSQ